MADSSLTSTAWTNLLFEVRAVDLQQHGGAFHLVIPRPGAVVVPTSTSCTSRPSPLDAEMPPISTTAAGDHRLPLTGEPMQGEHQGAGAVVDHEGVFGAKSQRAKSTT